MSGNSSRGDAGSRTASTASPPNEADDDRRREVLVNALLEAALKDGEEVDGGDADDDIDLLFADSDDAGGDGDDVDDVRRLRPFEVCQELLELIEKKDGGGAAGGGDTANTAGTTATVRAVLGGGSSSSSENATGSSNRSKNLTSNQVVSQLAMALGHYMSEDRVDREEFMPGTYDDQANEEAAASSQLALTLTRTSLLAANLYASLADRPGALGSGMLQLQALSSLSALLKRWRLECQGRESEALQQRQQQKEKRDDKSNTRQDQAATKKRGNRKKRVSSDVPFRRGDDVDDDDAFQPLKRTRNRRPPASAFSSRDGGGYGSGSESSSTEGDDDDDDDDDQPFGEELQSNTLSSRELVELGLQVARRVADLPSAVEFWSWSDEARDLVMDCVTGVLGTVSGLLAVTATSSSVQTATANGNKNNSKKLVMDTNLTALGQDVVARASTSLSQFMVSSSSEEAGPSDKAGGEVSLTKRHETIKSTLRGLLPLILMQPELPKGQAGKQVAANNASQILGDLIRNVSKDVTSSRRPAASGSRSQKGNGISTPTKTPSRNNHLTPMSTGGRSRRTSTARVSLGGGTGDGPSDGNKTPSRSILLSPPKLKTPTTCNRSVMKPKQHPSGMVGGNKMHPLLSVLVACLQTMVAHKDLEKASIRINVLATLQTSLQFLPSPERVHMMQFLLKLVNSKVPSHRQSAIELIGQVLTKEWFWQHHNTSSATSPPSYSSTAEASTVSRCKIMNSDGASGDAAEGTSPTAPLSMSMLEGDTGEFPLYGGYDSNDNLPGALLTALQERLVDKVPAIRASSANALANLFSKLLVEWSGSSATSSPSSHEDVEGGTAAAPSNNAAELAARYLEHALSPRAFMMARRLRGRCVSDDKTTVRKAALGALVELLLVVEQSNAIILSISDDDLAVFEDLCCDASVMTRKASAEALTRLLEACSTHREKVGGATILPIFSSDLPKDSASMLQALEYAWVSAVLPLALDSETTCVSKALELFDRVVLGPLLHSSDDDDDDFACQSAWRILATATNGSNQPAFAMSRSGGADALRAVLKNKAIVAGNDCRALLGPILKLVHQVCVSTLDRDDADLFKPQVQAQRSGAWCLFEATLGMSKDPTEISRILLRKKLGLNFLAECWEKLLNLFKTQDQGVETMEGLLGSMKSCLQIVSTLASGFDEDLSAKCSNDLERLLSNFSLPVDIIGNAVRAFAAVIATCDTKGASGECRLKIRSLLVACEDEIASHVGAFRGDAAVESKLVRAIMTTGELSLVGFCESDDNTSGSAGSNARQQVASSGDQPLRGLHERPSSRLVSLVQAFLPNTLPGLEGNVKSPEVVRAHAYLTLGKLCLRDEKLAEKSLNLLARELHENVGDSGSMAVVSNALLILGDLCVRYTNLVDRFLPVMACCLQTGITGMVINLDQSVSSRHRRSAMVRVHAIRLLSSLLIQDYIKWRGLLFHRFLVATSDEDDEVAFVARMVLTGPLLAKQPKLFSTHFVESLFVLNRCTAHPIYKAAAVLGDGGSGIAVGFEGIELSGEVGRSLRHAMYELMLARMTDEEKIGVSARIAKDVLGSALEEGSELNRVCGAPKDAPANAARDDDSGAFNVLRDAFSVLSSPHIRVSRVGGGAAGGEEENADPADPGIAHSTDSSRQRVVVAKGRLLSKLSRKHLIEIVMPILVNLKTLLQKRCSPLLKDLMQYMVTVYDMYKVEVKDVLSNDPSLLQEIEYDARQFKKNKGQQRQQGSAAAAQPTANQGTATVAAA